MTKWSQGFRRFSLLLLSIFIWSSSAANADYFEEIASGTSNELAYQAEMVLQAARELGEAYQKGFEISAEDLQSSEINFRAKVGVYLGMIFEELPKSVRRNPEQLSPGEQSAHRILPECIQLAADVTEGRQLRRIRFEMSRQIAMAIDMRFGVEWHRISLRQRDWISQMRYDWTHGDAYERALHRMRTRLDCSDLLSGAILTPK